MAVRVVARVVAVLQTVPIILQVVGVLPVIKLVQLFVLIVAIIPEEADVLAPVVPHNAQMEAIIQVVAVETPVMELVLTTVMKNALRVVRGVVKEDVLAIVNQHATTGVTHNVIGLASRVVAVVAFLLAKTTVVILVTGIAIRKYKVK